MEITSENNLAVKIIHSVRARHLRISIDHEKNVSLIIPHRVSEGEGIRFLNSKKNWVEKALKKIKPREKGKWEYKFAEGEKIFFFGLPHRFIFDNQCTYPYINKSQSSNRKAQIENVNNFVIPAKAGIKNQKENKQFVIPAKAGILKSNLDPGSFISKNNLVVRDDKYNISENLNVKYSNQLQIATPPKRHIFENFLNNKLREHIYAFAYQFSKTNRFKFKNLNIKKIKSRWGSCSRHGNVNFSLRLVHYPPEVINYVVIHELCHTREMNHSKKFWSLVAQFCPEYKTYIKMLK
jgi:predicted metal-dependent hydrolase